MQGIIDLADRIERELIELADEVDPGEPQRRTSEDAFAPVPTLARVRRCCEAVLLLEFAQDPLPKS